MLAAVAASIAAARAPSSRTHQFTRISRSRI